MTIEYEALREDLFASMIGAEHPRLRPIMHTLEERLDADLRFEGIDHVQSNRCAELCEVHVRAI